MKPLWGQIENIINLQKNAGSAFLDEMLVSAYGCQLNLSDLWIL